MKKANLILLYSTLLVASFIFFRCGGGGGKDAQSTSTASSQFENPTGDITKDNATQLMNDVLDSPLSAAGSAVEGFLGKVIVKLNRALTTRIKSKNNIRLQGDADFSAFEKCISGDEKSGSVDFKCLTDNNSIPGCSGGSGTIEFKTSDENDLVVIIKDLKIDCGDKGTVSDCNGEIQTQLSIDLAAVQSKIAQTNSSDQDISCANFSCTIDGKKEESDECVRGDDILIDVGDGPVVCLSIEPDLNCTSVSSEWEDEGGSVTIDCDVSQKDGTDCPGDIEEVSDCTITES